MLGGGIPRPSQVKSICTFTSSLGFHSPSYSIFGRLPVSTTQETPNEISLGKRKSFYPIRNVYENTSLCNTRQSQKRSNCPIPIDPYTFGKHPLLLHKLGYDIHFFLY